MFNHLEIEIENIIYRIANLITKFSLDFILKSNIKTKILTILIILTL